MEPVQRRGEMKA